MVSLLAPILKVSVGTTWKYLTEIGRPYSSARFAGWGASAQSHTGDLGHWFPCGFTRQPRPTLLTVVLNRRGSGSCRNLSGNRVSSLALNRLEMIEGVCLFSFEGLPGILAAAFLRFVDSIRQRAEELASSGAWKPAECADEGHRGITKF